MTKFDYDNSGKISLDHVYNEPDPQAYYSTLKTLDYRIPQVAKPVFRRLVEARRDLCDAKPVKVIDVGCSYGVNAALLKHDLSMDELYGLYAGNTAEDLRTREPEFFADPSDDNLSVVGVDVAEQAIAYAVSSGVLDGGVVTNLEVQDLTRRDMSVISDADMIISTGCVGYVTDATLERLVEPNLENNVWMANFVLRMFDYEPVEALMAKHGYVTETLDGILFPQRRFASADERGHVLENLHDRGVSPDDAEATGWYFAELHVSRPAPAVIDMPLDDLLGGLTGSMASAMRSARL